MTENYYDAKKHRYMLYKTDAFSNYVYSLIPQKGFSRFSRAIEFGAGMGRFSAALIPQFTKVILVEPTPAYAQMLAKSLSSESVSVHQKTLQEYIETERSEENTMVFCFHLLHHLAEPNRRKLFQYIKSIKARAVFVEPNPFNPLIALQILFHPDMSIKEEYRYLLQTPGRLRRELKKHRLSILSCSRVCPFPPFLMDLLLKKVSSHVVRKFELLARAFVFSGSYQIVVCE